MTATINDEEQSDFYQKAMEIYESELKERLLLSSLGRAVAIHADSGDFEVADTHRVAGMALAKRHPRDGRIVVLRIGPPTDNDIRMGSRMLAARKS
jgi:hypothetical protein